MFLYQHITSLAYLKLTEYIAVLTLNGKMGMEKGYEQLLGLYPNTLSDLLLYAILLGLHNKLRF